MFGPISVLCIVLIIGILVFSLGEDDNGYN